MPLKKHSPGCCCGGFICEGCPNEGLASENVEVTIAGVTNALCATCDDAFNGTHSLSLSSHSDIPPAHCAWESAPQSIGVCYPFSQEGFGVVRADVSQVGSTTIVRVFPVIGIQAALDANWFIPLVEYTQIILFPSPDCVDMDLTVDLTSPGDESRCADFPATVGFLAV